MGFHVPVMVAEVVRELVVDAEGMYLDATAGGGGHSLAIIGALRDRGRLVAVDRDPEAVAATTRALAGCGERALVLHGSFAQLKQLLADRQIEALHGVLFDLGVSSQQLDRPGRGFSFREEGPLDMRMDPAGGESAAARIARSSEEELAQVIGNYGEERRAREIARSICQLRQQQALVTTADLRRAVERTRPRMLTKTLARVFQAFRIAVNDELGELGKGLEAAVELLVPRGRLAAIAYHSLEDRLIKTRMEALVRGCICPPEIPVCVCGRKPAFRRVRRRPFRPGVEEVRNNRRARSAVMRIYEKL